MQRSSRLHASQALRLSARDEDLVSIASGIEVSRGVYMVLKFAQVSKSLLAQGFDICNKKMSLSIKHSVVEQFNFNGKNVRPI